MSLQEKYRAVINAATTKGIRDFTTREFEGVLHIDGIAPNKAVKDELWNMIEAIDPNHASDDIMLNIQVATMVPISRAKVVTRSSNINIRRGPATDEPVVGKAAQHSYVALIERTNNRLWHIRTEAGVEGYCYARYLSVED